MNRIKSFLRYNFSNKKKVRKYLGGYWEYWTVNEFGELWLKVSEKNAFKKDYKPPLDRETPYCEYYDIGFFGNKRELTDKMLKRLDRKRKLKRVKNEN